MKIKIILKKVWYYLKWVVYALIIGITIYGGLR